MLVIGAGASGLSAAIRMRTWADVVVVDKGRGVGGRLATRRIGSATFDHGAQFITARTAQFRSFMDDLAAVGVVEPWFSGSLGAESAGGTTADPGLRSGGDDVEHVRWRGAAGMTGIAKHLAREVDVRVGHRVGSLRQQGSQWVATLEGQTSDADGLIADAVVLTAPVPQALELLERGDVALSADDEAALGSVCYDPCLAVLAPLDAPWPVDPLGAIRPASPVLAWAAENSLKGVSTSAGVTLHATASASTGMWDEPDDVVIEALLAAAAEAVGHVPVLDRSAAQVQRWRYALAVNPLQQPCRVAAGLPPLVVAGDAFLSPRVEGAVRSGWAAAAALQDQLLGGTQRSV